jgi:hypothetical protein
LYIGNNTFTETSINALMETLVFFPKLKILGMNSAGVTDENIMNLGYVAESLPNLITLYLSANEITD